MASTATYIQERKTNKGISQKLQQDDTTKFCDAGNVQAQIDAPNVLGLSDVVVSPLVTVPIMEMESGSLLRKVATLMVDAVAQYTPKVWEWEFSDEHSLNDLIMRCADFLSYEVEIETIRIYREEEDVRLLFTKHIETCDTLYTIPLRPIFLIRKKNRLLFHCLLSFVQSLGFNNIFECTNPSIEYSWDVLLEREEDKREQALKNGIEYEENETVTFYNNHKSYYENYCPIDWQERLTAYNPKKDIYKKLKSHLVKAKDIDFNIVHTIGTTNGEEDYYFEYSDCFLITDDTEGAFTGMGIDILNDIANHYGLVDASHFASIDSYGFKDFDHGTPLKLKILQNYLIELMNLLEKLS